jgi:ubiquinone/menaquinone biosynthesis C-methylase UbiE
MLASAQDGLPSIHKEAQARFTDEADEEWEINRPHGGPAFYAWLLEEKFRRSLRGLPRLSPTATVLTVCGGSGLEAEFLARSGLQVVSADISLEAARRVRKRARRFSVEIIPVVADAERLPFPDRSFDVVYVHDGLHHLEDPGAGLVEMARVASRAVSVNEPAQAAVTALAVRFGLALDREEAGNRVARLRIPEVSDVLSQLGFQTVEARRFAMYYKHVPGRVVRALSHKATFPLARAAVMAFNRVLGRVGNKLTVQAIRT